MLRGHSKYCFKVFFFLRLVNIFATLHWHLTLIVLFCARVAAFTQKATVMQMLLLPLLKCLHGKKTFQARQLQTRPKAGKKEHLK